MTWRDARFTKQIPTTAADELRWIAGFSSGASNLTTFLHSHAKDLYGDHFSCTSLPFHADFWGIGGLFCIGKRFNSTDGNGRRWATRHAKYHNRRKEVANKVIPDIYAV